MGANFKYRKIKKNTELLINQPRFKQNTSVCGKKPHFSEAHRFLLQSHQRSRTKMEFNDLDALNMHLDNH
jgi:hypothetical protein